MMIVLVVVIGVRGGLRQASQTSLDDRCGAAPDGAAAQLSQLSGDQAAARLLRTAGCISLRHAGHPTRSRQLLPEIRAWPQARKRGSPPAQSGPRLCSVAGPMPIRAIHHVDLAVRDVERSLAFYRRAARATPRHGGAYLVIATSLRRPDGGDRRDRAHAFSRQPRGGRAGLELVAEPSMALVPYIRYRLVPTSRYISDVSPAIKGRSASGEARLNHSLKSGSTMYHVESRSSTRPRACRRTSAGRTREWLEKPYRIAVARLVTVFPPRSASNCRARTSLTSPSSPLTRTLSTDANSDRSMVCTSRSCARITVSSVTGCPGAVLVQHSQASCCVLRGWARVTFNRCSSAGSSARLPVASNW